MQPKLLDPAARDEVTTGRSEGDQGSDVALESLSSQNKPLLILSPLTCHSSHSSPLGKAPAFGPIRDAQPYSDGGHSNDVQSGAWPRTEVTRPPARST